MRDCSCREGECLAGDNYVEQVKDVLNHSVPKGGKIAAFFAGIFLVYVWIVNIAINIEFY